MVKPCFWIRRRASFCVKLFAPATGAPGLFAGLVLTALLVAAVVPSTTGGPELVFGVFGLVTVGDGCGGLRVGQAEGAERENERCGYDRVGFHGTS